MIVGTVTWTENENENFSIFSFYLVDDVNYLILYFINFIPSLYSFLPTNS